MQRRIICRAIITKEKMSNKKTDTEKLYEREHYFIAKEIPRSKEHPYAWRNRLNLIVKKIGFNEHGEHHHGVKWVKDLEEGKSFIESQLEKGR